MKFTFKRDPKIDWTAELPRFRAARIEDDSIEIDAEDMQAIDIEIIRRIDALALARRCTPDEASFHFRNAAGIEGTEEYELARAKSKALNDLLKVPR
jgi:hypothetical protein